MTPPRSEKFTAGPPLLDVDAFVLALSEDGYAASTLKEKRHLLVDLSKWLEAHRLDVGQLDQQTVERFLRNRARRGRRPRSNVSTLRTLLSHLDGHGVEPRLGRPSGDPAGSAIENDFAEYLTQQRALAPVTRDGYVALVRRFIAERFGGKPIEPRKVSPSDVVQFVERYSRGSSRGRTKLMSTALRAFFRFLRMRGDIEVDLGAAIPLVAHWRLAGLPKGLEPQQVEQVLRAFDAGTATGRRDRAIVLLLARLGLRAGEVVAMTLDDLDWSAGTLLVRGKGPRRDTMPLPADVGEALVAYLRNGRPVCSTRRVFVRAKAPHCGFASSVAVCTIVRGALARAGLEPPHKGAHVFRHALASQMLQRGASLAEIGDVLRHRRPDTTMIYTKIDLVALRSLVRAWPGGAA
jgi:integrase/recombinase XerD